MKKLNRGIKSKFGIRVYSNSLNDIVGHKLPEGYRQSSGFKNCGGCAHFNSGFCKLFQEQVRSNYTCNVFKAKDMFVRGNKANKRRKIRDIVTKTNSAFYKNVIMERKHKKVSKSNKMNTIRDTVKKSMENDKEKWSVAGKALRSANDTIRKKTKAEIEEDKYREFI